MIVQVRIFISVTLMFFVGFVKAASKTVVLDDVKYSYGIFAPVGLTVGAYIGYIISLGLVLGALVLLIFSKGWRRGQYGYGFDRKRSLGDERAFEETSMFDYIEGLLENDNDAKQFWSDRLSAIAEKF